MKNWTIILLLLLMGCGVQFPLYMEKDLIEVPELVGAWAYADSASRNNNTTWTLTKQKDHEYKVVFASEGIEDYYIARFLRLKGQLFIDLQNVDRNNQLIAEGHLIGKVDSDSSMLHIVMLNSDYLVDLAKENKIKLAYKTFTDNTSDIGSGTSYLISEPTKRLQALMIKYKDDKNVFPGKDAVVFHLKRQQE